MKYPVLITKELEENGISGSVHFLSESTTRVFATNILLYLLKGQLSCSYKQEAFILQPGDFLFICEGEPILFESQGAYGLLYAIPGSSLFERQQDINCNSAVYADKEIFSPLKDTVTSIIKAEYYGGTFFELKLQALWKECLYSLLSTFYTPTSLSYEASAKYPQISPKKQRQQEFTEILNLLEKNYQTGLKLNDLADLYYYTPSYLSKLFVKYTGMHFSEYLTELRLKKAMVLLTQTNLEISMISDKTGFPNPRAFQQSFQKKYHLRPSVYRSSFQNLPQMQQEHIRTNIRALRDEGILDIIFQDSDAPSKEVPLSAQCYFGTFSCKETSQTSIGHQNKVLNIYRAKDLLLDNVQEQVLTLQREIGYEYLNCHGFLADDMQIYFEDRYSPCPEGLDRRLLYSFSLYEKIFQFAKDAELKFIIQLGYTPSFLASSLDGADTHTGSRTSMPISIEEWNDYIFQLFTFLKQRFGDWLSTCPVLLWQTPDIQIQRFESITFEDFCLLYQNTYHTVKSVLPDIPIASPTISCSQSGLLFERDFLPFCATHQCMPDMMYFTHISANAGHLSFRVKPIECRGFVLESRSLLNSLKIKEHIPFHLLEYFYDFGTNALCDSMIGAMLPLKVTLENQGFFESFGYWAASDFTTETVYGKLPFSGNRGIFSLNGEKKPIFYGLQFLSRLGNDCLKMGDGFVLTKKADSIQLLLFYDIPENEWAEPFSKENALDFYEMYLTKHVSLDITDIEASSVIVKESYLNYESGSAYENWLRTGGELLTQLPGNDSLYVSTPQVIASKREISDGTLHYACTLKPFELRFVDFICS